VNRIFKAEEFLDQLSRGTFDGCLHDELSKLSIEQLKQVALLMTRRLDRDKPAVLQKLSERV